MKIIRWFTALVFLASCMVFAVSAETHHLPEIGVTVESPQDWVSYSRAALEVGNHPNMSAEIAQDYVDRMSAKNVHLAMFSPDGLVEVNFIALPSSDVDLRNRNNEDLMATLQNSTSFFEESGLLCTETNLYHHTQTPFIQLELIENGIYRPTFITVYAKMNYQIIFYGQDTPFTDAQRVEMMAVMDSIVFAPESDITYFDKATGVSFTIPAGATQTDIVQELETGPMQAVMFLMGSPAVDKQFTYYCMDFYSLRLAGQPEVLPRDMYSMQDFTEEDYAVVAEAIIETLAAVGGPLEDWHHVRARYQDIDFLRIDGALVASLEGIDLSLPYTAFVRLHEGWLYVFYFVSLGEPGVQAEDIDSIMETVRFSPASAAVDETPAADDSDSPVVQPGTIVIAIALLIILALAILAAVKHRRKKAKPSTDEQV